MGNAGYTGDKNTDIYPYNRGTYWIWFKQDYFQKSVNGCTEITVAGSTIEHFRCVFFAKMFFPQKPSVVKWSMTWVYIVTYDTKQAIETEMVADVMQCANPADCPNAATITGLSIKAANFAQCSFFDEDVTGALTKPLNTGNIVAGTDVMARCSWDTVSLEFGQITVWEQGMDGYSPTSAMAQEIRTKGFPNNTHIKS